MDSNKNNTNIIEKEENEFDIRDIANYLLGKLWIILLATLCFVIVAIIFTSTITPKYQSESELFITNSQESSLTSSQAVSDWTIGRQLAVTSPELVTEKFCNTVADKLNADPQFVSTFGPINGAVLLSYLNVTSNEDTCIVTFTVTTDKPELSKVLANEVAASFEAYIQAFMKSESIRTVQSNDGKASNKPSNISLGRNVVLAGVAGALLACVVLIIVFMFDDKIKTPDDIDRYLNLSVLGVIPEIDTEG